MHISDITSLLFDSVQAVLGWFNSFFHTLEAYSLYSFLFVVVLVVFRLLVPWIRSVGSDRVKNTKLKTNNKKGG